MPCHISVDSLHLLKVMHTFAESTPSILPVLAPQPGFIHAVSKAVRVDGWDDDKCEDFE